MNTKGQLWHLYLHSIEYDNAYKMIMSESIDAWIDKFTFFKIHLLNYFVYV